MNRSCNVEFNSHVCVYLKHAGDLNRDADPNEGHGRISRTERLAETGDPVQPRSLGNRAGGGKICVQ